MEARREEALERSLARFDAVAERFQAVYGLRLPRHLAVAHAFFASLSDDEAFGLYELEIGPSGLLTWFDPGGLERTPRDGLDPRLDGRFRRDPPELVNVMAGGSDGLHWGLWFDDPDDLPSFVASLWARDSAEVGEDGPTVLHVFRDQLQGRLDGYEVDVGEPAPEEWSLLLDAARAFADADAAAVAADGRPPFARHPRRPISGGIGPALPAGSGDPRWTEAEVAARARLLRSPEALAPLVAAAHAELRADLPAFALVLGRELHWATIHRDETALGLLCGAYEALGRSALADIARVHHANRDLPLAAVYR